MGTFDTNSVKVIVIVSESVDHPFESQFDLPPLVFLLRKRGKRGRDMKKMSGLLNEREKAREFALQLVGSLADDLILTAGIFESARIIPP